ncbi:hypothetical protein BGX27_001824 [Mortierella sp. AM989]|nr:hypothetical protein BGX27_001824 [Mortierella sp. AM989]
MTVTIDKTAILIRPYTKDDYDQVASILIQGFKSLDNSFFSHKATHYTTFLSIISKSIIYTILVEIALTAFLSVKSSPSTYSSIVGISLEDLQRFSEVLMKPESAQTLILQFLQPSLLIIWIIVSVATGLATMFSTYRWAIGFNGGYIESCFKDDLYDIPEYYQSQGSSKTRNRSQFWIACLKDYPQVVMGCIGLDDMWAHKEHLKKKHLEEGGKEATFVAPKETDAELRRLSVHSDYRRLGIGRMLIDKLVAHAKENEFKRVIFSTTFYQTVAIAGYIRYGFDKEKISSYGNFTRLWHGTLNLNPTKQEKEEQRLKHEALLKEINAN